MATIIDLSISFFSILINSFIDFIFILSTDNFFIDKVMQQKLNILYKILCTWHKALLYLTFYNSHKQIITNTIKLNNTL